MAITQAMCTQFKRDVMLGLHDLDTDTIKIALYTSSATLGATTTAYATTNEEVGTGYTAGGALIYNDTESDLAIAVLDFGGDFSVAGGTFRIVFPAQTASTAIVRID